MTYLDVQTPIRKTLPAGIAGFALFLAGAISVAGVNLFGSRVGFGFVPFLVLILWPRRSNTLLSLALVFMAGVFTDWAVGGILGQSTLLYVLVWGFLRPELRSSPFSPARLFLVWLGTCGLALIGFSLSGMFVLGIFPDIASMGRQIILASCLLPLVLLLRRGFEMWFNDRDDWG